MPAIKTSIQNILLIDDDKDDCDVFEQALHLVSSSLQLSCIHRCEDVFAAIKAFDPDLIFLDINLPCITGFDCLKEMQESAFSVNVPIVMYSSSENPKEINAAYRQGASLYFKKPTSFLHLVQSLKDITTMPWEAPSAIKAQFHHNGIYLPFELEG